MGDQSSTGDWKTIGFGVAIAFLAPGVVALWGAAQLSPTVARWFGVVGSATPSTAGFLFVLLASLSMGVFISGVRHIALTWIFRLFGVKRADNLDEGKTADPQCRAALNQAVEDFFRYHQFYGNMTIGVGIAFAAYWYHTQYSPHRHPAILALVVAAVLLLLVSAGFSLKRYYEVERELLR